MILRPAFRNRGLLAALISSMITIAAAVAAQADTVAQSLPFVQDWSNASLITTDNDWSGVPGIIGIRGDDLTLVTGTDPQTIVAEQATLNVLANQANTGIVNGGVAEFDGIANRAVALQGSGTADAPYIQFTLQTTGVTLVRVQYQLRDLDASTDNAIQPVALQYRVGTTGNVTNVPAAFVADATTGPSQATLVTPVSIVLPAEAGNQPVVQLRVITTNAVGNDEWVAVDDIEIANASTPPSGAGSANPDVVVAGETTLLQVFVTPGELPQSTGLAVEADLSSIGGLQDQPLYDDGTHGDDLPGDNLFQFEATVALETLPGLKLLPVAISDAEARSSAAEIAITVTQPVDVANGEAPAAFAVGAPFPNPFLSAASITFELPQPADVSVTLFDAKGRIVKTLHAGLRMPAGRHAVVWDGRDDADRRVAAGVYLCRIAASADHAMRRVVALE